VFLSSTISQFLNLFEPNNFVNLCAWGNFCSTVHSIFFMHPITLWIYVPEAIFAQPYTPFFSCKIITASTSFNLSTIDYWPTTSFPQFRVEGLRLSTHDSHSHWLTCSSCRCHHENTRRSSPCTLGDYTACLDYSGLSIEDLDIGQHHCHHIFIFRRIVIIYVRSKTRDRIES
jgi:hypothetical protein